MNKVNVLFFKSYNTDSQILSSMVEDTIKKVFSDFGYDYTYEVRESWGLIPSNDSPESSAYSLLKAAFDQ